MARDLTLTGAVGPEWGILFALVAKLKRGKLEMKNEVFAFCTIKSSAGV